jgi:Adenylate and Guanylate cyclase catalytic domain
VAKFSTRTPEDQIVEDSVSGYEFYKEKDVVNSKKGVIFLPTGDGICIVLLNINPPEYDHNVHMNIAFNIIKFINNYGKATQFDNRKFKVYIGLNEHRDNMVIDINKRPNIVGTGINMASRIMSLADENQILVSESVFSNLKNTTKYTEDQFRKYCGRVKHGTMIRFYQFVGKDHQDDIGLNTAPPSQRVCK